MSVEGRLAEIGKLRGKVWDLLGRLPVDVQVGVEIVGKTMLRLEVETMAGEEMFLLELHDVFDWQETEGVL